MRSAIVAIALSALCLVAAGAARQDLRQPVPRFRTSADVVVLDVSVLDRSRMPVRGLTAADFTILEDGRPQRMSSFTAVDLPDTERIEDAASSPAWMRDVAPDVQRNDDPGSDRGVFVIVLDDATPMMKEDVAYARQWARGVVEQLGPASGAVVYTLNKRAGQEFTEDRARLLAAIDRFNGSIEGTGKKGDAMPFDRFDFMAGTLYRLTTGTLREVAERLAELPLRRKAIVFVSVGIPLDVGLTAPELISGDLESSTIAAGEVVRGVVRDLRDAFVAAQRANVNIYSLDPGGLRAPGVVRSPLLTGSSRLEPNPGQLNREFLQTVSESSGGFAVTNTNDPAGGITQIIRENASYYLLGYDPANARAEGRYRRVEVRVNRPGVTVRVRSGYREPDARRTEPPVTAEGTTRLAGAIAGPLASAGLSLRVTAAPFMGSAEKTASVAVVLGVRQPGATASEARADDTLQVLTHAYDGKGQRVASEQVTATIALRPRATGEIVYEVLSRLELKPGRYHLRVAAESARSGSAGSVYCDIDVPDFGRLPLSLSGVVLGVTPGPPSGAKEKLASLLPVVPTAEREFGRGDRVSAFIRVYQGGRSGVGPVSLRVQAHDQRNALVFEHAATLAANRFAGRSADVLVQLPLSSFTPGPHLLTIEAEQGRRKARRDVRLAVRD